VRTGRREETKIILRRANKSWDGAEGILTKQGGFFRVEKKQLKGEVKKRKRGGGQVLRTIWDNPIRGVSVGSG